MSQCLVCGKLFTPKKPTGQPCCSGKCLKQLKKSWVKSSVQRKEAV